MPSFDPSFYYIPVQLVPTCESYRAMSQGLVPLCVQAFNSKIKSLLIDRKVKLTNSLGIYLFESIFIEQC